MRKEEMSGEVVGQRPLNGGQRGGAHQVQGAPGRAAGVATAGEQGGEGREPSDSHPRVKP